MCAIFYWYIKGKGIKLLQERPLPPMLIYYTERAKDNIGWDNMMQVRISRHCNQCQSDYLKKAHPGRQV